MRIQTTVRLVNKAALLAAIAVSGAFLGLSELANAKTCDNKVSATPVTSAGNQPSAAPKATQSTTIVDIAAANPAFETLVAAVKAAGLVEVLSGQGPFTVFAPTDEAFAALPKGTLEKLLKPENKEKLKKILTYHVVPGSVTSASIRTGQVKTVEGSPVMVKVKGGKVTVNNAAVTSADIQASNGVIHVIDKVILPPDL